MWIITCNKYNLNEIKLLIEEEVLPFFEVTEVAHTIRGVCGDPDDDKFLSCALAAAAEYVVSGDKDLCDLGRYKSVRLMNASDFLRIFS